ncbi:MAG: 1-acyl-sn-glycerol-3-phosphate acyltransferase [Bacteroidetes bacterium]|nr:1-acyl-sn-glycerol-3-phosphate acyltransferase [Bacteroidota bacterium]
MRTGLRFFYRHAYVTGMEHIPRRSPVILIANHPSSLMDAALMGVLLRRRLWYFTRGDVFVNTPVRKLLSWLHMIPVHQHERGRSSLDANDDSFLIARNILKRQGVIVFFPESTSHTERRLWAFRKGVFRLAFRVMEDHDFSLRLPIVPIGISYDHPVAGRQCVQVHAGPPLYVDDYTTAWRNHPAAALLRIVKDAQERMSGLVLHIENSNRCTVAEQCLTMYRSHHRTQESHWRIRSRTVLAEEQKICRDINRADEKSLAIIQEDHKKYFDTLGQYGLNDQTVAHYARPSGKTAVEQDNASLLLSIGYPLYLLGMLLNNPPVWIARRIADKKVTRDDFYSWVYVCGYCLLYFLWMTILLVSIALFNWKYSVVLPAVMVSTGLFSYKYVGWKRREQQNRLFRRLSSKEREMLIKTRENALCPL